MIIIKIDYREKALTKKIKLLLMDYEYDNVEIEVENLPLGDMSISRKLKDGTLEELIIFERKTLNDLASSIKDGRYSEQSYRLNKVEHHNHNIVYIVEGNVQFWKNRYTNIKPKTLYVTMFCLNYYKGFSVLNTSGEKETAEYLLRISNKLNRESNKKPHFSNKPRKVLDVSNKNEDGEGEMDGGGNENGNDKETEINEYAEIKTTKQYVDVRSKVKKDHITMDNIDEILLCQIPSVSATTAKAIMNHFKSIHELLNTLSDDRGCLNNVKYKMSNGIEKRITKKSIRNIIKFLLKDDSLNELVVSSTQ